VEFGEEVAYAAFGIDSVCAYVWLRPDARACRPRLRSDPSRAGGCIDQIWADSCSVRTTST